MILFSGLVFESTGQQNREALYEKIGHKIPIIWIMVADSQKAYFFQKPNNHLEKIGEVKYIADAESKLDNANSGRVQESVGRARHRIEKHEEELEKKEHAFMKALADFLNREALSQNYDRLILALSPKALGILRPMLNKEVNVRISAQLGKDITSLTEDDLFAYLDKMIKF